MTAMSPQLKTKAKRFLELTKYYLKITLYTASIEIESKIAHDVIRRGGQQLAMCRECVNGGRGADVSIWQFI